jgi:hypothetical protein
MLHIISVAVKKQYDTLWLGSVRQKLHHIYFSGSVKLYFGLLETNAHRKSKCMIDVQFLWLKVKEMLVEIEQAAKHQVHQQSIFQKLLQSQAFKS